MANKDKNSNIGVTETVTNKILTKKWQTANQIYDQLKTFKVNIPAKNLASRLLNLCQRNVAVREKINGIYNYKLYDADFIKHKSGQQVMINLTTESSSKALVPKKKYGVIRTSLAETLRQNINIPLNMRDLAEKAGLAYNSAINNAVNQFNQYGFVELNRSGPKIEVIALPQIMQYDPAVNFKTYETQSPSNKPKSKINSPKTFEGHTIPKNGQHLSQDELMISFQKILEIKEENDRLKQVLFQIAALLESAGTLEISQ